MPEKSVCCRSRGGPHGYSALDASLLLMSLLAALLVLGQLLRGPRRDRASLKCATSA